MKATNNSNADLKQEIDRLMDKASKLQILVDDAEETLADVTKQKDQQRERELAEKDEEIKLLGDEKSLIKKELDQFKGDYKQKMQQIKLMELKLEEKLAEAKKSDDDGTIEDDGDEEEET